MTTFWEIIQLVETMQLNFLLCRFWLKSDLLSILSHARMYLRYSTESYLFFNDMNLLGMRSLSKSRKDFAVSGHHCWKGFCLGKLPLLEENGIGSLILYLVII